MKKPSAKKVFGFMSAMITGIVAGANIMAILLALACGLCTFAPTGSFPLLGLFCLAYPILALVNMLFIPFWLLFRWRYTIIPVAGMAITYSFTQSYCPVNLFLPDDAPEQAKATLRVMSYNAHNFKDLNQEGADTSYTWLKLLRRDTFDIICVQEGGMAGTRNVIIDSFMTNHGYRICQHQDGKYKGNVVFSRLPLVDIDTIHTTTLCSNRTAVYRFLYQKDTLVVVNAHLESYRLEEPAKEQYRYAIKSLDADSTETTGRFLVRKMRPSMSMHSRQMDSIASFIAPMIDAGKAVILCGDFNDSPVSYACRKARTLMDDAYREAGFGPGFTYNEKAMPFRIDHIFCSSRFRARRAWVEKSVTESDHYPIGTILDLFDKK